MPEDVDRPNPDLARTAAEFVDSMRRLKSWSGQGFRVMQKRALAIGTDLPRSTLTAVLSRETLPRVELVVAFTRVCGCDEDEVNRWIAAWRRVASTPAVSDREPVTPMPELRPWVVPAQLPAPSAVFVGRTKCLRELDARIPIDGGSQSVSIVTITGTAGVGKTALAVHWAHSVADRFPDGQLYVNLRGFGAGQAALSPAEALSGFLDAFALPSERIPAKFEAQVGLFRSLLAGRRMLVVLDNAFDDEQLLPLLPAAHGCMAIATSRNQLSGLIAGGAQPLVLGPLTEHEGRDLLARRVGKERVTAEQDATHTILGSCVRLPLALSIVAARAATHPQFSLRHFADELRGAQGRLDALGAGDTRSDIRTVFSWSYLALRPEVANLFRQLGLHPGPDITKAAAASIAGCAAPKVRRLISELSYASLVIEHQPGRFLLHDLLRVYANELAHSVDGPDEVSAIRLRVLGHYLQSAQNADRLLYPNRDPVAALEADPKVVAEVPVDVDDSLAWFSREHLVLKSIVGMAFDHGHDWHVWKLCWAMANYLERKGHWQDWKSTQEIALQAAYRLGDQGLQAETHRSLGRVHNHLGNDEDTHTHFKQALESGGPITRAHSHINLAQALERQERYREAQAHTREALELYRAAGHLLGQGNALNTIGWIDLMLGDCDRAIESCTRALEIHASIGHQYGQCSASDSIGMAHHRLGHDELADASFLQALGLARDGGDRHGEATVLRHLGEHRAAADPGSARELLLASLTILDELGHADAEQVREQLRELDWPG